MYTENVEPLLWLKIRTFSISCWVYIIWSLEVCTSVDLYLKAFNSKIGVSVKNNKNMVRGWGWSAFERKIMFLTKFHSNSAQPKQLDQVIQIMHQMLTVCISRCTLNLNLKVLPRGRPRTQITNIKLFNDSLSTPGLRDLSEA